MKKQLFGILALVLAIGFSAFTPHKNSAAANNAKQTDYYWYAFDDANDKVVGSLIDYAEAYEVKTGTCTEDAGDVECLRGFNSTLAPEEIGSSPAPSGVDFIYEQE